MTGSFYSGTTRVIFFSFCLSLSLILLIHQCMNSFRHCSLWNNRFLETNQLPLALGFVFSHESSIFLYWECNLWQIWLCGLKGDVDAHLSTIVIVVSYDTFGAAYNDLKRHFPGFSSYDFMFVILLQCQGTLWGEVIAMELEL